MNSNQTVLVVFAATVLSVSSSTIVLGKSPRGDCTRIVTISEDTGPLPVQEVAINSVEQDDAEYYRYIEDNLPEEPETHVDHDALMSVVWVPGVGLVDQ
jgi:hypothetical protein